VRGRPSDAADVELALDAAHAAKDAWGKTSAAERAVILNKIADRIEANLQAVAEAETWDNGKPVRETLAADIPLAVDHFRYFAGCIRAQEGGISEMDHDTVAYHFHEPLGVVGQIIPWNFPMLMAAWKIAPALAAGNCIVMKPAEQTPASILVLIELIQDMLPRRRAEHRLRAPAPRSASPWPPTPASPRSPSPARPPSARRSWSMRPRTSFR
jgi:aldehyde dehydrogenase